MIEIKSRKDDTATLVEDRWKKPTVTVYNQIFINTGEDYCIYFDSDEVDFKVVECFFVYSNKSKYKIIRAFDLIKKLWGFI